MGTLDRKKPFGIVSGITEDGHRFEQDGRVFNAQGKEIVPDGREGPFKVMRPDPVPEVTMEPTGPEPEEKAEAPEPTASDVEAALEEEMTRHDIMAKLNDLHVAYDTRARKSVLLEMLRNAQENQGQQAES